MTTHHEYRGYVFSVTYVAQPVDACFHGEYTDQPGASVTKGEQP